MKADGSSTEPVTLDAVGLPTGSAAWVPFFGAPFAPLDMVATRASAVCGRWASFSPRLGGASGFIHHLDAFGGPWRTHFLGEGAARVHCE